ncbi:MAG: EboA domain-containing protein [Planctomycetota bacterium]
MSETPWIPAAREWLRTHVLPACAAGAEDLVTRLASAPAGTLGPELSKASRFARSKPLGISPEAACKAAGIRPGWNPERLQALEGLRMLGLLSRDDLATPEFAAGFLGLFAFADEGELRALYKTMALLPAGERFAWQAAEGCRANVLGVFEAVACDTPYPAAYFDDVAWRSLCIKAVFLGAPLWRVAGIDGRGSEDVARVALDLVEERRSAGRPVPGDLWILVGRFGGERAHRHLLEAWQAAPEGSRGPLALALARAGLQDRLPAPEAAGADRKAVEMALAGDTDPARWRVFSVAAGA